MDVPYPLTGEQPKISIWLDDKRDNVLKKFHCPICGKVVFEYYNSIKIIVTGEMEKAGKSPKVIQCHGSIQVYKNGYLVNTKCKAKFWVE